MSASAPGIGKLSGALLRTSDPEPRKPTHGTYTLVRRPATALLPGLHRPHLPDLLADRHRLDPLPSPPLHHRGHLLLRPGRHRPLVPLPSLLQPRRLGPRYLLHVPRQARRHHPRPGGHSPLGRRRHPLPQARPDPLRRRHALRPADLQPRQIPGQLGTRLGRPLPDHRPPVLGPHQGLRLAHRLPPLPQPPRPDQGEEGAEGRQEGAPTRTRSRIIAPGRNWPWN